MPTIFEQNPALTAVVCAAVVLLALLAAMALLRRKEARERGAMEERILDEQAEMLDRLREAMFESARGAREGQEQSLRLLNQTMSASATARQLSDASMAMETRQERMRQTLDERLAAITALNDGQTRTDAPDRFGKAGNAAKRIVCACQRAAFPTLPHHGGTAGAPAPDGGRAPGRHRPPQRPEIGADAPDRFRKTGEHAGEPPGESFKAVNEQLSRVYKGLGEMQSLAQGVGDLKKVLTNVKTRGVLGRTCACARFWRIASPPASIWKNAQVTPGSMERVEFAIRLPRRRRRGRASARGLKVSPGGLPAPGGGRAGGRCRGRARGAKSSWKTPCASRPGASATNT